VHVILETIAGTRRVQEACEELEICEQRFEAIRVTAIQAAIAAMEARPLGRPARVVSPDQLEIAQLRERIAQLEAQLHTALIQVELSSALPQRDVESGKAPPRSGRAKESKRSRSRPGNSSKR
jgi:hypothetical protein